MSARKRVLQLKQFAEIVKRESTNIINLYHENKDIRTVMIFSCVFIYCFKLIKSLFLSGLLNNIFFQFIFQFAFKVLIHSGYLDVCSEIRESIQLSPSLIFLDYKLLEGRNNMLFFLVGLAACSKQTIVTTRGVKGEDQRNFERGSIF